MTDPNYTTYNRENIENRIKAASEILNGTLSMPRYMTRGDVKQTLRYNQYILKRMGNENTVTLPNSELDNAAKGGA